MSCISDITRALLRDNKGEQGNSTVKTNRAHINVHTFNKLLPKNLGPNHFSKREIVRQSSPIIPILTPCCSFLCRRKSGERQECDVIACFFIAGIETAYRRAIQISKARSYYKQNAAFMCCAIVYKWQWKNQRDGYKLSYVGCQMGRSKIFGCEIYVERTFVIVIIQTSVALTLHLIALKQIPGQFLALTSTRC